jgi:hemolysin III
MQEMLQGWGPRGMSQEIWPYWGMREPVSAVTHLAAFFWAVYATMLLCRLCRGDRSRQRAMACFGLSMIALYAASAAYHIVRFTPDQIHVFRLLDQSAIYGLIAGTYTPVLHVLLNDPVRKRFLIKAIWTLAGIGIAAKWFLPREPYLLTVILYFGLAAAGLLCVKELRQAAGVRGMLWVAWGGVFYTIGALVDYFEWPIFYPRVFAFHELFHVCTMAGTFCHYVFMLLFVVPYAAPETSCVPGATAQAQSFVFAGSEDTI